MIYHHGLVSVRLRMILISWRNYWQEQIETSVWSPLPFICISASLCLFSLWKLILCLGPGFTISDLTILLVKSGINRNAVWWVFTVDALRRSTSSGAPFFERTICSRMAVHTALLVSYILQFPIWLFTFTTRSTMSV